MFALFCGVSPLQKKFQSIKNQTITYNVVFIMLNYIAHLYIKYQFCPSGNHYPNQFIFEAL